MQKMFACALQDNAGNAERLQSTLQSIVPHAYGEHSSCSDKWCGFHREGSSYKHSGLPRGNDLSFGATRSVLEQLFEGLATQAEKLAPLGSSQINEAFINTVCSQAPKARHYGGSESYNFHIAASVLQKNKGHSYVSAVLDKASLSPSRFAVKRAAAQDRTEERCRSVARTKAQKLRRRLLRDK